MEHTSTAIDLVTAVTCLLLVAAARLGARKSAMEALPQLQREAAFSARTGNRLRTRYQLARRTEEVPTAEGVV